MKHLSVAIGGFLGAICRYVLENIHVPSEANFPINTFIINIIGSFILGLILTIGLERFIKNENARPLITVGFISSFTTFSTFTFETIKLIENGSIIMAAQYALFSLICGLFAVKFGSLIGISINNYITNKEGLVEVAIEELE